MAASSASGKSTVAKKVTILGVCVVAAIGLYTGGWYFAAEKIKEKTLELIAGGPDAPVTATCRDAEMRGYPFRLGLFCSGVNVDDHRNGVSASFGALRSAAQVYDPQHIVWELDQPATIHSSDGLSLSSEWSNLQSSVQLDGGRLLRSALVVDDPRTSIAHPLLPEGLKLNAKHGEMHLRRNGMDLDATLSLDALAAVLGNGRNLPPLGLRADVTVVDGAALLQGGGDLAGHQAELRKLSADLGEGRTFTVSGPLSVDEEGYLSGRLKVEVAGIEQWRAALKAAAPEADKTIDTAINMLTALVSGGDTVSVDLVLQKGKVLAGGFIPVAKLPPLFPPRQ